MSLESKIEGLTEALDRNTAAILASIGVTDKGAAPAKTEPPKETKKAETKKAETKKAETKKAEPDPVQEPDEAGGAEARDQLIALLTTRFAKGNGTAEKNRSDAEGIKAIYSDYGFEKAGDVPLDKAAEVLARVEAFLNGEAAEDGESLI